MATQWTANVSAGQILTAAKLQEIGAAWETYTPAVFAQSGTITTLGTRLGKYTRINKLVLVHFDVSIVTNGTGGTWINIGKPLTSVAPFGTNAVGFGTETAVFGNSFTIREASTTAVLCLGITAPSYVGANGARITGFFTYEAA